MNNTQLITNKTRKQNLKEAMGFLILMLVFSLQTKAQELTENDIIGKWSVVQINVLTKLPEGQKKTIDLLKEAFLRSTFEFNPDNSFVFDFELEKMKIQNGHWKYNDYKKSFIIQDWKDKDTTNWKLMEIFPKRSGNQVIFQLPELFIELIMNKEY
ncbi:MAG: hypothetical protein Q8904_03580 [Bacteroidota bacterium]|nr:hypothetical protein [Bacteroidota bacterium]